MSCEHDDLLWLPSDRRPVLVTIGRKTSGVVCFLSWTPATRARRRKRTSAVLASFLKLRGPAAQAAPRRIAPGICRGAGRGSGQRGAPAAIHILPAPSA